MSQISDTDPPERLVVISRPQFYNVVEQDVRKKLEAPIASKLRHELVVPRWLITLRLMRDLANSSIAVRNAETRAQRLTLVASLEHHEQKVRQLRHERNTDSPLYLTHLDAASALRIEIVTLGARYDQWRQKSLRFGTMVDERLSEAVWLNSQQRPEACGTSELRTRLDRLLDAIAKHREEIEPEDATEIDEALWSVLPD